MLKITPAEMQELVMDVAAVTWSKFRRAYPTLSADVPLIRFSNRLKTTAGLAYYEKGYIVLSNELLWQYGETLLDWVIPHEYGHIVAWRLFKESGHGTDWKNVVRAIGANDSRLHYFVNHLHETRKLIRIAR